MPDEPTLGEVLRRLDETARQLQVLAKEMRDDRINAAATYVRRDVYDSDRRGDALAVIEVQKDIDEATRRDDTNAQFRRQVMLALAVLSVTTLVSIALTLLTRR